MELREAIAKRRSVRAFANKEVESSLLKQLADWGQMAPSASNLQGWKFLFVTNSVLKEKVDMFCPGLSGKPPVILVICSDLEKARLKQSNNAESYGFMMDASMAAENIMLGAVELGLGTCAIKSFNDAAIRKILGISDAYRIELLISIGYPAEDEKRKQPARQSLEKIAFFNSLN